MVEQIIKYSDGTETSIKYRGVIIDGVLQTEEITGTEETVETPTEAIEAEEVAEIATEEVEETPAESVEDEA